MSSGQETTGVHTEIADAVVDALNDAVLSMAFTASRVYIPNVELSANEDTTVVRVWTDPEGRTSKAETRSKIRRQYPVLVAVLRRCDVNDNSDVDSCILLVEEIEDLFTKKPLDGYPGAVCLGTEQVVAYAWEALKQNRQYAGVVKLTFVQIA